MINEAWVFFSNCFQFIYFYVFFIYLSTMWTIFADFLMKMRRFLRMNVVLEKFFFWHVKTIGPGGSLRSKHLPRSWGCVTDKTGVKKETDAVSNDHRGRLIGILWYDKYKFFFFHWYCFCPLSFQSSSVFHGINDGTRSQRTEADTRASPKSESIPEWPGKVKNKVWS